MHLHRAPDPVVCRTPGLHMSPDDVLCNARAKIFPGGECREIMVYSYPVFNRLGASGSVTDTRPRHKYDPDKLAIVDAEEASSALGDLWEHEARDRAASNLERAQRRARTAVFDLAYCNDFSEMITLTLDPAKIDRYDYRTIVRKLNRWLSNRVQRRGFRYVIVPELHEDGAIHFHGLCNDVLTRVDSGHKAKGGKVIYNLPEWDLGFTTCVMLNGVYEAACRYVCKYISKSQGKVGGRYYLSGGGLQHPRYVYFNTPYSAADGKEYDIGGTNLSLKISRPGKTNVPTEGNMTA